MLKLTLLLALCGSGDNLQDRLHARLQEMRARARESVLHVLENIPREKRREAAEELLRSGRETFEKRFHGDECCPRLREAMEKTRARVMKRVFRTVSEEWKRMPDEEKQEIFKFLMEIYNGLPKETKKAIMKEVQGQIFKGLGSRKKKK